MPGMQSSAFESRRIDETHEAGAGSTDSQDQVNQVVEDALKVSKDERRQVLEIQCHEFNHRQEFLFSHEWPGGGLLARSRGKAPSLIDLWVWWSQRCGKHEHLVGECVIESTGGDPPGA